MYLGWRKKIDVFFLIQKKSKSKKKVKFLISQKKIKNGKKYGNFFQYALKHVLRAFGANLKNLKKICEKILLHNCLLTGWLNDRRHENLLWKGKSDVLSAMYGDFRIFLIWSTIFDLLWHPKRAFLAHFSLSWKTKKKNRRFFFIFCKKKNQNFFFWVTLK